MSSTYLYNTLARLNASVTTLQSTVKHLFNANITANTNLSVLGTLTTNGPLVLGNVVLARDGNPLLDPATRSSAFTKSDQKLVINNQRNGKLSTSVNVDLLETTQNVNTGTILQTFNDLDQLLEVKRSYNNSIIINDNQYTMQEINLPGNVKILGYVFVRSLPPLIQPNLPLTAVGSTSQGSTTQITTTSTSDSATIDNVGYVLVPSSNLTNVSDASSYNVYNFVVNYSSLKWSGNISSLSFTSYVSYTSSNTVVEYNTITFQTNTLVPTSTSVTTCPITTKVSNYTKASGDQKGTFIIPLVAIPKSVSITNNLKVGIKLNGNAFYLTYGSSTNFTSLTVNTITPFSATLTNIVGASSLTITSNTYTVAQTLNYYSGELDKYDSRLSSTKLVTTTDWTAFNTAYNDSVPLCYVNIGNVSPETITSPGKCFGTTSNSTVDTYWNENTAPYIRNSTRYNNYLVAGYNTSSTSASLSLSLLANGYVSVSTNSIPKHPLGTFPNNSQYQVSGQIDYNVSSYSSSVTTITINKKPSAALNPQNNVMQIGQSGILFTNTSLYNPTDLDGINPASNESVDIFLTHPGLSGNAHCHFPTPMMYNFIIDKQPRVIGVMKDGYFLLSPFLISTNSGDRVIKSSDLNKFHGITGNISITYNGVTAIHDFAYVCTYDYPYTIAAYYGTPQ